MPAFDKTAADEAREEEALSRWVRALPEPYCANLRALYAEMDARETLESRIYKAIDGLEAVIQHNEAPVATWIPLEYDMNLSYAEDKTAFSPYLKALRQTVRQDTEEKIAREKP